MSLTSSYDVNPSGDKSLAESLHHEEININAAKCFPSEIQSDWPNFLRFAQHSPLLSSPCNVVNRAQLASFFGRRHSLGISHVRTLWDLAVIPSIKVVCQICVDYSFMENNTISPARQRLWWTGHTTRNGGKIRRAMAACSHCITPPTRDAITRGLRRR